MAVFPRTKWVRSARLLTVACLLPGPAAASEDPAAARVTVNALPPALTFFSLVPCRVVDTRNDLAPLVAGTPRTFTLWGACAIPPSAVAVSMNVAVTEPTAAGNVRLYPAGSPEPTSSAINYSAGQTRTNNAIVGLGPTGGLTAVSRPAGSTHLIIDVNGYFELAEVPCDNSDQDADGVTGCGGDCCDIDARVRPGQTAFFNSPTNCGGYDYNCDATPTPQYTEVSSGGGPACSGTAPFCIALAGMGWLLPQAPGCGLPASYRDCTAACGTVTFTRVQSCR